MDKPKQRIFAVAGLEFAAQEWGREGQLPVLALHGWLDNSASFSVLSPKLNNVHLVAVDLAGHGQSGHRRGPGPYNIWEDVGEIFAIADALGWQRFALLGHSRGGIISAIAAGTFPERISHLALIEGILPEVCKPEDAPRQLALSIRSVNVQTTKPLTLYRDKEAAVTARENGMFPLSNVSAKALTERGLKAIDGGFSWSTDPRLFAASAVKLLPEQMAAFVGNIKAPIKLILGEEGLPKLYPNFRTYLERFPQIDTCVIAGNHHLHMEQEVDEVAAILDEFFADQS
ncbi:MAG TPA: alpha/beta hydrolase [Cellvibrio sp.]|nr:alpha/beta hydrolase [Cellvibrio sp.]